MHEQPIIDTDSTEVSHNRFPILFQLGILGVVLSGIFGVLHIQAVPDPKPQPNTEILLDTTEYQITPQRIEGVSVQAEAAFVWDVTNQRALYEKNPNQSLPLASITKLMTALLTHELLADSAYTEIPLSAIRQEGSSGFTAGEELAVKELREIALVSSSNDAAYALAANVGALLGTRDPAGQFVAGMNIRAEELGLHTLEFYNPTGLDESATQPGAVGSAKEISLLMEYILRTFPELITPTQLTATRIYNTAGAYHEVVNTNQVAREIPNLIGSKTGYTDLAGGNLTVAFEAGLDRPIIITVLGSTRDGRFTDVLNLTQAVQKSITTK